MESLPSSIEASLLEAGFSTTEILILKRLLEDDATSLRQIAMKSGKSTGVLDQAMKKLLKKGIVTKENINGSPRYLLQSLEAIMRWMERDMVEKQEMMKRRHSNFESFLATLSADKVRPDMEHFEGEEGIKKAYTQLLECGNEMLAYLPVTLKEEDDPLREFRVQYFRERRSRELFQRVIAFDTPLGRRYQSRDPFEYRKTILIPEGTIPMGFEQVIVGNTFACFDHSAQKACFIRFPHLVDSEREFFEALWNNPKREITIQEIEHRLPEGHPQAVVGLKTRVLSAFREFMLSRRSLVAMGLFAVLSGFMTYGMYSYTQQLNLERMKEQVKTVASTGASQFNPEDLDQLRVEGDWTKPQWAKVVNQMKEIRVNNENILFVYLIRKSKIQPGAVEFLADSHSLNPYANTDTDPKNDVDANLDGVINSADVLQWPGQLYETTGPEVQKALESPVPITDQIFYEDQWGKVISGYAPIRRANGEIVAVLAADIEAKKLGEFTAQVFQPIVVFISLFLMFVVVRFAAFNQSLLREVGRKLVTRKGILGIVFGLLLAVSLISAYRSYQFNRAVQEVGEKMKSVTATMAPEFSANDIGQIHWARDMSTDAYQRVFKKLNEIRNRNPEVQYAVILRPINTDQKLWEFVVDSDANYFLPYHSDQNLDSTLSEADEIAPPGTAYYLSSDELNARGLKAPMFEVDPIPDQWGKFLTATSPIYDENGKAIAMLNLSIDVSRLSGSTSGVAPVLTPASLMQGIKVFAFFGTVFLLLILARFVVAHVSIVREFGVCYCSRMRVLVTLFVVICVLGLLYAVHLHSLRLKQQQIGERLKSIAATAAPQFSADDIAQIYWARDMKTEAYQRLFTQLNEVRNRNPGIVFSYIFRPTADPKIVEFVADADTNYVLPFYMNDFNQDGTIDHSDAQAPPGTSYYTQLGHAVPGGMQKPTFGDAYTDQWGSFISACAPIQDSKGQSVAAFCVDVSL